MSVEAITIALHHSRSSGAARAVLIGIANHDGDGGAWPAMATLAKYANVSRRSAQQAVRRLEDLGEIATEVQQGGNGRVEDYQRPNLYHFVLRCPPNCDGTRQHKLTPESMEEEGAKQGSPHEAGFARGAKQGSPKTPNNHLTTDIEIDLLSNRAREPRAEHMTKCETNHPQPHRINRRRGLCADCLEPIAAITSPNRKEGDA